MSSEYANPGDTIIARNTSWLSGERLLVIEKPRSTNHVKDNEPGCAWFTAFSRQQAYFLRPKHYVVVERAGKVRRIADEVVKSDVDVEASLKKQRDNNLRHAFGF